ncbi:MAG: hypothetical protein ACF8NJ_09020 [Phycisphaerales bacterium JB038]
MNGRQATSIAGNRLRARVVARAAGLTLLELLIALTLLVLLVSLSVPSILVTLDRRQFNEVRQQILTYMTLVRAEAQLHGEVLVVYYEPPINPDSAFGGWEDPVGFGGLTPGDVEDLSAFPGAEASFGEKRPARLVARPYEPFATDSTAADESGSLEDYASARAEEPRPRSTLRMNEAFRLSRNLPEDWLEEVGLQIPEEEWSEEMAAGLEALEAAELEDAPYLIYEDESEPIILAVFFPDGTAVTLGERLYLVHDEGNAAELIVNRWTGQADLMVLQRESEEDLDEPEKDEEYDPFDEEALLEQPVEMPLEPMRPGEGP